MSSRRGIRALLTDPICLFVVVGIALYVAYRWLPTAGDQRLIQVDRDDVMSFVQYRRRRFDDGDVQSYWSGLDDGVRRRIIDEYVREEAQVREARALGLDRDDYVVRQRLIQRLIFVKRGGEARQPVPDDDVLKAWYAAQPERYRQPAAATFTHVFLASAPDPSERVDEALELKERLNERGESEGVASVGDRFPYHRRYVLRSLTEIDAQFGGPFANELSELPTDRHRWQGPLESSHGLHLVRLENYVPAGSRPFAEVREQVLFDWEREVSAELDDRLAEDILARYRVVVDPALRD